MKCVYSKTVKYEIFGRKFFEIKTDYIEHSRDTDAEEDDMTISLKTRINQYDRNNG